jgi:diacylglycerol kinase family enzyme
MQRRRHQKSAAPHWGVLVNPKAASHSRSVVESITKEIKRRGGYYTLAEPDSSHNLLHQAQVMAGLIKDEVSPDEGRFGKITGLIAVGGDGTFNLVARAAHDADLPVGIIPTGRFNNIARWLYGELKPSAATAKVLEGNYRKVDVGIVGDRPFFGSIGLGLVPELAAALEGKRTPLLGIGWSRLGAQAAAKVKMQKTLLKVDAVKFDFEPIFLNVNLLPYSVGLPFSPVSIADDGLVEVLCDQRPLLGNYSSFVRQIYKRNYLFGKEVCIYRGKSILCQPTQGRTLYVDGELVKLQTNSLDISLHAKQLMLLG